MYTRAEFEAEYGGTTEWEHAAPVERTGPSYPSTTALPAPTPADSYRDDRDVGKRALERRTARFGGGVVFSSSSSTASAKLSSQVQLDGHSDGNPGAAATPAAFAPATTAPAAIASAPNVSTTAAPARAATANAPMPTLERKRAEAASLPAASEDSDLGELALELALERRAARFGRGADVSAKRMRSAPTAVMPPKPPVQVGGCNSRADGRADGPMRKDAKERQAERFGGDSGVSSSTSLAASDREEMRYDTDGGCYTKAAFVEFYGEFGSARWLRAEREQQQQRLGGAAGSQSSQAQLLGTALVAAHPLSVKIKRLGHGDNVGSNGSPGGQGAALTSPTPRLSNRQGKRPMQLEPAASPKQLASPADGRVAMELALRNGMQLPHHKRDLIAQRSKCCLQRSAWGSGMLALYGTSLQLRHATQLLLTDAKGAKGGTPELHVAVDEQKARWVLGNGGGTLQQLKQKHTGVSFKMWRPGGQESARVISLRGEPSQIKEAVQSIAELWLGRGSRPAQHSGGSAGTSSSAVPSSSGGASANELRKSRPLAEAKQPERAAAAPPPGEASQNQEERPPARPEGTVVKPEEAIPAWAEGAVVKPEEKPPVWPEGAVVKPEELVAGDHGKRSACCDTRPLAPMSRGPLGWRVQLEGEPGVDMAVAATPPRDPQSHQSSPHNLHSPPRSPHRAACDGQGQGEDEARAEQDRRLAETEGRLEERRLEVQRLEAQLRHERQLKEQAPLPDELRETHVECLWEAVKDKRILAGWTDARLERDPWKNFKVRREPVVCAFTQDDLGRSLSITGGAVKVNGVERVVLWGGPAPEDISKAKILSLEERVGGQLKVPGAGGQIMSWDNPATGLVAQVLAHMSKVKAQAGLWRKTRVIFEGEDGVDDGGLTEEMHTAFWKGVISSDLELFECAEDLEQVHTPAFLPKPGACTHNLEMVGLMMCKSLINGHPTGPGIGRFVFDFLLEAEGKQSKAFAKESKPIVEQAETAIVSLSHYDVQYASLCRGYLRDQETDELRTSESIATDFGGMDLGDLVKLRDGHELFKKPMTVDNLPHAIVASSRWVLQGSRLAQLQALRKGFTCYVDMTTQLRLLPSPDVMLVVQGRAVDILSAEQLIAEIEWPHTLEAQAKDSDEGLSVAEEAGFPPDSTTCELLRRAEPPAQAAPGHAPMPILCH